MHFISVLVNFCFLRINEKYISSSTPRNSDVTISFFENLDLEWYSRSGEISLFNQLILGMCLHHPVFLSDVLSDAIGVTSNYSANSTPSNCQSIFSKAKNLGHFFNDPPGI